MPSGLSAQPKPARSRVRNCSVSARVGRFGIEMPGRAQPPRPLLMTGRGGQGRLSPVGHQDLGRTQALDFRLERGGSAEFHHAEAAGGQVEPGKTESSIGAVQAGQQGVAAFVQQRFVGHGARSDDAYHLALHGALGLAGLAALLADGDRLALAYQFHQIGVERDCGYARHRNGSPRRCAALGERDVQQLRGAARVVVEHFIEIAHAIEQQHVGMLCLDAQVLLHHRGVRRIV